MPLAEYLASEQARPETRQAIEHGIADAPGRMISTGTMGAWSVVLVTVNGESVSAYYRPDGDRYVVTDLGEGVRAYRLATGRAWWQAQENDMKRNAISHLGGESGHSVCPAGGAMELAGVTAGDLPDAICRVMLASLRVTQS